MGTKQARSNFSEPLGTVHFGHETVIVEKASKPFVVVISPEQYEHYRALVSEQAVRTTERMHERNEHLDPEQLERDITAVVEQVRQERHERRNG